jgi:hypothetical protein
MRFTDLPFPAKISAGPKAWPGRGLRSLFVAFLVMLTFRATGLAQAAKSEENPTEGKETPIVLPKITVIGESMKNFPFIPKTDLTLPGFKYITPSLFLPGRAYFEGVYTGEATVGVMLDVKGNPVDFLLIRYTRPYFGDALLRAAHNQDYTPRMVKGVPVPGRFNFGYQFTPGFVVQASFFDAMNQRYEAISGGPRFIFGPTKEREIDGGILEFTETAVPFIPNGYEAPKGGKAVKVLVTFYVDEKGHVRLPNVESADSPLLIPNAIKAALHWAFTPPTVKGKPVLVFAARAVTLVPPTPDYFGSPVTPAGPAAPAPEQAAR